MNANTARMHRLTLRFADAELEKAFAESGSGWQWPS